MLHSQAVNWESIYRVVWRVNWSHLQQSGDSERVTVGHVLLVQVILGCGVRDGCDR